MGRRAVRICFFFPRVDFDAAIRSHMVDEEALTWDCVIACVGLECNRQIWDHPAIQVSSIPHTVFFASVRPSVYTACICRKFLQQNYYLAFCSDYSQQLKAKNPQIIN
jgi:hypothetical protein